MFAVSLITVHNDSNSWSPEVTKEDGAQHQMDHVMVTSSEGPGHELSSGYGSETGDQQADMKRLHIKTELVQQKGGSVDSDNSDVCLTVDCILYR